MNWDNLKVEWNSQEGELDLREVAETGLGQSVGSCEGQRQAKPKGHTEELGKVWAKPEKQIQEKCT